MQTIYQKVTEALLRHGVLFVFMAILNFLLWQKIKEVETKSDQCNAQFQNYLQTQVVEQNKIIERNTMVQEEVLRAIRIK